MYLPYFPHYLYLRYVRNVPLIVRKNTGEDILHFLGNFLLHPPCNFVGYAEPDCHMCIMITRLLLPMNIILVSLNNRLQSQPYSHHYDDHI
jgi:hypothetical protein